MQPESFSQARARDLLQVLELGGLFGESPLRDKPPQSRIGLKHSKRLSPAIGRPQT